MKKIETKNAPSAIGPYSQAVASGGFLFGSGQIPVNPETGAVPEGIETQARQVFENITAVLTAGGLTPSSVVKTTVFLTDLANFQRVNELYADYFTEPFPARSCVEVKALPKGVLVEVEYIASLT